MKTINMYYVYDTIGETVITQPIPAANDLVAAIGFRDGFIKCAERKYNYKGLELHRFATFKMDVDGKLYVDKEAHEVFWKGSEIMDYIINKTVELGIDDDMLEEEQEEKE